MYMFPNKVPPENQFQFQILSDEFFLFFKALYENHDPTAVAINPKIPTTMPTISPSLSPLFPLLEPELSLAVVVAAVVVVVDVVGDWVVWPVDV